MIFSPSFEYALQALIHLAGKNNGTPVQVKDIAQAEDIPKYFLAKILNYLDHENLVKSVKGPGGGFKLSRPAGKIKVSDVIEVYDGLDHLDKVCILGLDKCQEPNSCALHKEWKQFRQLLKKRVQKLTIADMWKMRETKRGLNKK
ncbi:MAG TPA: Rrf2 family transcriptional regulator [candidate division Zixibacteria bacterium]|nr:Rrf2 family transcriptional regulator [candidate division Zixibacteria bacterium]